MSSGQEYLCTYIDIFVPGAGQMQEVMIVRDSIAQETEVMMGLAIQREGART